MPLLYSALAGISLGLYIDAWSSGFLFEGIILLFILLQSIVDHLKGRNVEYLGISGAITFFVATLLVLPFVKPYYGFNHYLYGLFQPTILLLGVVAVIIFSILSKLFKEKGFNRYYYPGALAGIAVLGTLISIPGRPSVHATSLHRSEHLPAERQGERPPWVRAAPCYSLKVSVSWPSVLASFPVLAISFVLSSFFLALHRHGTDFDGAISRTKGPGRSLAFHLVDHHSGHDPGPEQVRLLLRSQCGPAHGISRVLAHAERSASRTRITVSTSTKKIRQVLGIKPEDRSLCTLDIRIPHLPGLSTSMIVPNTPAARILIG